MEKLRIKYSEMYTIVPAEIESQVEECRKALEDVDEKVIIIFVLVLLFIELNEFKKKISFNIICSFALILTVTVLIKFS